MKNSMVLAAKVPANWQRSRGEAQKQSSRADQIAHHCKQRYSHKEFGRTRLHSGIIQAGFWKSFEEVVQNYIKSGNELHKHFGYMLPKLLGLCHSGLSTRVFQGLVLESQWRHLRLAGTHSFSMARVWTPCLKEKFMLCLFTAHEAPFANGKHVVAISMRPKSWCLASCALLPLMHARCSDVFSHSPYVGLHHTLSQKVLTNYHLVDLLETYLRHHS